MQASKFFIASILAMSLSSAANASTVEAVTLLNEYNLITSGDVTSTSEVEGNALIGGNLSGGSYNIHSTSNTAVASLTVVGNVAGNVQTKGKGLNVGGDVSGTVTINDGGDAYVNSVSGALRNNANGDGSTSVVTDISGNVSTNGGNTTYGGALIGTGTASANGGGVVANRAVTSPLNATTYTTDVISTLSEFSGELVGIEANSNYSITGGKVRFNATPDSNGLAVFTINNAKSFFDNAYEFDFKIASSQSILFNVFGGAADTLNLHANFLGNTAPTLGSILLWNFVDATSLNITAQFGGSLLALNADVVTQQNIEGTLVAKSLVQGAEVHSQPSSFIPPTPPVSAVPVPAAAFFFAPILFGGMVLRRKLRA